MLNNNIRMKLIKIKRVEWEKAGNAPVKAVQKGYGKGINLDDTGVGNLQTRRLHAFLSGLSKIFPEIINKDCFVCIVVIFNDVCNVYIIVFCLAFIKQRLEYFCQ